MTLTTHPCRVRGCGRPVLAIKPLAPCVCAVCAFWSLQGAKATLYTPLGPNSGDVYYLDPHERLDGGIPPTLTARLDDGGRLTSPRFRCLGVPPVMPSAAVRCLLAEAEPSDPMGLWYLSLRRR